MSDKIPNRIKALPVRKPGPIIAGIIVFLLAIWIIQRLVTNKNFAWPTVWKYLFNEHILTGVMLDTDTYVCVYGDSNCALSNISDYAQKH